jgi:hypothetical protein
MTPHHALRPSRRDLLVYGLGAAAASFFLPPFGRALADEQTAASIPGFGKAQRMIVVFLVGGPSQFETLDPKPGTTTGGPTKTVASAVTGIEIADSLPGLAKRMKDLCIIRSMTSKEGSHERARYLVHTGYSPNPTLTHPSIGAILSHEKGMRDSELPEYVSIGGPGAGNGYLEVDHAPFVVQDPKRPIANLEFPIGMSDKRRDARLEFLAKVNDRFAKARGEGVTTGEEVMFEKAKRLMDSKKVAAFDLSKVSDKQKEAYGSSEFGAGCLMARRLLDEGVTCVEVMSQGWDTHDDDFNRTRALGADVDQGLSALIDDLKGSGLLDTTLIAWVGDFGRTPDITASQGRGHYPKAWSAMLAGGGVQGGRVIGKTDDQGREIVERPVTIPELFASFAHAMGVDGHKEFHTNGRPITLVDKAGTPIPELFRA